MTERDGPRPFGDLSRLLAPQSIAVVGASDQPGNLGGVAIHFLQKFGYPGTIWPINPRRQEVHDIPCLATLADLPGPVDLAILATAAETAPSLVRECAAAGIRFGVIWAGGFAEVGGQGRTLQDNLEAACRETGFAIVGPNCIGIINTWMPAVSSFASFMLDTKKLVRGRISMVSQSGGLATMAQAFAQQTGSGFRYMISAGNEATLTIADYVHALAHDADTKVIALYLEGVRDGDHFLAALDVARAAGKPVVALKGGDTVAAARAAAAHTGALAGEGRVWDAVFREKAVIRVQSLEELHDVTLFLASADLAKLPAGSGVAAVTTGGGSGVLSADQCARHGLAAPQLTPVTRAALRPLVPPIAAIDNPIDLTPQVYNQPNWFANFGRALDVIADDPGVHAVLIQFGPMGTRGIEIAREIVAFRQRCAKTVCIAWPLSPPGVADYLLGQGIHVFGEYARAIVVLAKLARYRADIDAPIRSPVAALGFDWAGHAGPVQAGTVIAEHDCHRILAAAGLAVAPGRLARSADEAVNATRAVGLPVVMKGISPQVTHRAAAGLVVLDISAEDAARQGYEHLVETAKAVGAVLDGVYVQHMVRGGTEVLISAFRDPVLGIMISCGAGGNLTELIDDVVLARAPLDHAASVALLRHLRLIASVAKSRNPRPLDPLADYVARLSQVAMSAPWQRFVLEINPVKWSGAGVIAVDGLLIIEEP